MRWRLAVAVVLLVAAGCGSGETRRTGGGARAATTTTSLPVRSVDRLGDDLESVLATASDGQTAWFVGAGKGQAEGGKVAQVDLSSGRIESVTDVPDVPLAVTFDAIHGTVWVMGGGDGADPEGGITRLDARTLGVRGTTIVPGSPRAAAVVGSEVWVVDASAPQLWRVSVETAAVLGTLRLRGPSTGITVVGRTAWVTSAAAGAVTAIDTATGAVRATVTSDEPTSVVGNASAVWVGGLELVRIDPETGDVVTRAHPVGWFTVTALSPGWVWGATAHGVARFEVEGERFEPQELADGAPGTTAAAVGADAAVLVEDADLAMRTLRLPLPTPLVIDAEQLREGENFGFLRDADERGITLDLATTYTTPEATRVAVLDGTGIGASEGIPNDVYDRNLDGRTVRLPFAGGVDIALVVWRPSVATQRVALATFLHGITAGLPDEFMSPPLAFPFVVDVRHGTVIRLTAHYRP